LGKRSNFDRKEKDFYVTQKSAFVPLVKHLPEFGFYYVEPCYGTGALKKLIWTYSVGSCVGMYDLYPELYNNKHVIKADARTGRYNRGGDFFITNPPWDRSKKNGEILHKIIDNLAGQKPTWLLFDADWVHTKQSAPYMKYCVKVVSVGRVKWFEDSKHTGKDNCCWYLFDKSHTGPTEFIGR